MFSISLLLLSSFYGSFHVSGTILKGDAITEILQQHYTSVTSTVIVRSYAADPNRQDEQNELLDQVLRGMDGNITFEVGTNDTNSSSRSKYYLVFIDDIKTGYTFNCT